MRSNTDRKNVLLGVSSGIAMYKVVHLARLLVQAGIDVQVVGTPSSRAFVGPATWEGITGNQPLYETFEPGRMMEHIAMPDRADAFVIAPATASVMEAMVQGRSDHFLLTSYLAASCPVLVAPSMNVNMWNHPATRRNVAQLRQDGCQIIEPGEGSLACGWTGQGRLAEPETIFAQVQRVLAGGWLAEKRIVITGGATREYIDPVRFLSNPSTGSMGIALAEAAWIAGAEVDLILGESAKPYLSDALLAEEDYRVHWVGSAQQMLDVAQQVFPGCSWYVSAAAVADYTTEPAAQKTKKGKGDWELSFSRTTDILATVATQRNNEKLVGFAAETHDVVAYAKKKLDGKKLDAIVYNDVSDIGSGFGPGTNAGGLLFQDGLQVEIASQPKSDFAEKVLRGCYQQFKQVPQAT